jgi:hypothetical protein
MDNSIFNSWRMEDVCSAGEFDGICFKASPAAAPSDDRRDPTCLLSREMILDVSGNLCRLNNP